MLLLGKEWPMANPWTHEGGAAWLDAVLYDAGPSEEDPVIDTDPLCSPARSIGADCNVPETGEPVPKVTGPGSATRPQQGQG